MMVAQYIALPAIRIVGDRYFCRAYQWKIRMNKAITFGPNQNVNYEKAITSLPTQNVNPIKYR
jgi:hypothetical protein